MLLLSVLSESVPIVAAVQRVALQCTHDEIHND
jgi:hypothetical protein